MFDCVKIWCVVALRLRGSCDIVEFVGWWIVNLITKAQNDWGEVGRSQVAMHRICHFF